MNARFLPFTLFLKRYGELLKKFPVCLDSVVKSFRNIRGRLRLLRVKNPT